MAAREYLDITDMIENANVGGFRAYTDLVVSTFDVGTSPWGKDNSGDDVFALVRSLGPPRSRRGETGPITGDW